MHFTNKRSRPHVNNHTAAALVPVLSVFVGVLQSRYMPLCAWIQGWEAALLRKLLFNLSVLVSVQYLSARLATVSASDSSQLRHLRRTPKWQTWQCFCLRVSVPS